MGDQDETKKVEEVKVDEKVEDTPTPPTTTTKDVSEEKSVIPVVSDVKDSTTDDSKLSHADEKAIVPVTTPAPEPEAVKKTLSGGSIDRDIELGRLEQEKKLALVKAWEESEKSKAENKACKKLSDIESWENSKKASIEAELRKIEEKLEKKKAQYAETMKNKVADVHKLAEEKRAMIEAQKGEQLLKAEECAAKFRATGHTPKKFLGCF